MKIINVVGARPNFMKIALNTTRFKILIKRIIPERYYALLSYIYHTIRYFGFRFKCPCCGGHFRMFLPYGIKRRVDAQCPRCGVVERHRLLYLYLKNKTNFFKNHLKVLHIAPMAHLCKKFENLKNLDYISADISCPGVMIKMDITDINLPNDQIDCVICYHVLEHIVDDEKAMRELFRVLKPGGWAILQSPVDSSREKTFEDLNVVLPGEREQIFGQRDHVRVYGRDYKDRLEMAGFTVKFINYAKELEDDKRKRFGVDKCGDICFCTKPKSKNSYENR